MHNSDSQLYEEVPRKQISAQNEQGKATKMIF